MQRMYRLAFALLAAVLCNACDGQDTASVQKAWQERQERIKDLHLKWTEQSTHFTLPGETAERDAEFAISSEGQHLAIGDSYSMGSASPSPNGPGKGVERKPTKTSRQTCVDAYDGVTCLKLFSPRPTAKYHALFIDLGLTEVQFGGMVLNKMAVQWFCRPFAKADNSLRDGLSGFECRPDQLDGEKCLVLDNGEKTIWVTPDDRSLMIRTTGKRDGVISYDIRVRYAEDKASSEWLPSGWDFTHYGVDGKFVLETRTAKVTKASVHVPLPVELFQVAIPDGTWVTETIDRKQTVYIHRVKKGPRYIRPREFTGDNYEALLNSEPSETTPAPSTK